jgi:hypothetical protein
MSSPNKMDEFNSNVHNLHTLKKKRCKIQSQFNIGLINENHHHQDQASYTFNSNAHNLQTINNNKSEIQSQFNIALTNENHHHQDQASYTFNSNAHNLHTLNNNKSDIQSQFNIGLINENHHHDQAKIEKEKSVKRNGNFQENTQTPIQTNNDKLLEFTHVSNKKAKVQMSLEKDTEIEHFETLEHAFNQAILIDEQKQAKKLGRFMENVDNESDFDSDDDYDCSSESDREEQYTFEESSDEEETADLMNSCKLKSFMHKVNADVDPYLYPNSQIKFKHFVAMVVKIFEYLNLGARQKNLLVLLLRACLPRESLLEGVLNYKSLISIFEFSDTKERKICGICSLSLGPKELCLNPECQASLNLSENVNKGETHLVEMDLKNDLKEILEKHWSDIKSYKEIFIQKNNFRYMQYRILSFKKST